MTNFNHLMPLLLYNGCKHNSAMCTLDIISRVSFCSCTRLYFDGSGLNWSTTDQLNKDTILLLANIASICYTQNAYRDTNVLWAGLCRMRCLHWLCATYGSVVHDLESRSVLLEVHKTRKK